MKIHASTPRSVRILAAVMLLFATLSGIAQVTIIVNKVPDHTPKSDTLFLAGTLNDWTPRNQAYAFTQSMEGTYILTLPVSPKNFDYKITRGSWPSVEGDIHGKKIGDRNYSATKNQDTIKIQVLSWEDLTPACHWNVVLEHVPANTPFDASIYIAGDFNNWKENDEAFKLTRLDNGTYAINIPKTADTLWYKFNRGSWSSVEARYNSSNIYNRHAVWDKSASVRHIRCHIEGWEDLTNGTNLLYSFILLASAFQAIVLILSIAGIRHKNKKISWLIMALLTLTCIALFARTASYNQTLFNWAPKLLLLSDLVYFLYAPLFFAVIRNLSGAHMPSRYLKWLFIVSAATQLVLYLPMAIQPRELFINTIIDQKFSWALNSVEFFAMIYNLACWIYCIRIIYTTFYKPGKTYGWQNAWVYTSAMILQSGVCMLIWTAVHVVYLSGLLFDFDAHIFHEIAIDVLWVTFALSTSMHAVLMIRYPDLFRIIKEETDNQKIVQPAKEKLDALKAGLAIIMKNEKLYLNSKLTLQDLADAMHTNIHTLSRIINDGYQKNFFDFINEYRINEFKRLANMEQYRNYTFLAIAMEVGFSSKTTFNRSFKKSTGKTPREYFNVAQEAQLESVHE